MKKCPYCAEMIQDEAILCRYCGSSLPVSKQQIINKNPTNSVSEKIGQKPRRTKKDLEKPRSSFYYFIIGLGGYFLGCLLFTVIFLPIGLVLDNIQADNSTWNLVGFTIFFILFVVASIIASKGMNDKSDALSVIGVMIMSFLPFLGQILAIHYLGKGIYMMSTKQKFIEWELP